MLGYKFEWQGWILNSEPLGQEWVRNVKCGLRKIQGWIKIKLLNIGEYKIKFVLHPYSRMTGFFFHTCCCIKF